MVLLAAAVCNKQGKALISRQFVEMTRSRIEGLLASFSKLMTTGKQHTFVETETVRFVYQPIDKIYMVLITTRNSNILEDLETLRLFARVVPEYCKLLDETDVLKNAFSLIFAFDEIVALGYRESVSLAQIRTFTEMDSQDERIQIALRQTQEREAKEASKRKAKELTQMRKDIAKLGRGMPSGMGGMGSSASSFNTPIVESVRNEEKPTSSYQAPKASTGKAMKLGVKTKDVDHFVDQLKSEGEKVMSSAAASTARTPATVAEAASQAAGRESVHVESKEEITMLMKRDGGLVGDLEITGTLAFRTTDENLTKLQLTLGSGEKQCNIQLFPKFDKAKWLNEGVATLKDPNEAFPLNIAIPLLRWRMSSSDESDIPLAINCWPSEAGKGCTVNVEYVLNDTALELNDVVISIPIPQGTGTPIVGDLDNGQYSFERGSLMWKIPVIDDTAAVGTMEFTTPGGNPNSFFPIRVNFTCGVSLVGVEVEEIHTIKDEEAVKFSTEHTLAIKKYEII
ncbi:hypothetical protein RvY_11383 [Ramazzottius varieornatus]|uniref:Coatomer subunit delta n=1 Tax=Ramazzottius varieornatus TaxID=947166 RepID=A0A1D1VG05_RAMVA|nr:hypothetical protein RvY_11383 [Ramazzottius varieornatus]